MGVVEGHLCSRTCSAVNKNDINFLSSFFTKQDAMAIFTNS